MTKSVVMIKVDKISYKDILIYYTRYEASSGVNIVLQENELVY